MAEQIALFDMDDTLVDFDGRMLQDLLDIQGPEDPKPITVHDKTAPIWLQRRKHLIMQQRGWWRNLPPKKLGFDIMNAAAQIGFTINVLTKGPTTKPHAWLEKVEWCKKHIGGVPITITENKGLVYGRVLVDDYPQYMEDWLKWRKRAFGIMPMTEGNKVWFNKHVLKTDGSNIEDVKKVLQAAYDREPGKETEFPVDLLK